MKILSIDGGGIRGLIPALLLKLIDKEHKKLKGYFDICAGTSTGGIIAQGLGYGYDPAEIYALYIHEAKRIFSKNKYSLGGWIRPKYNLSGMEEVFTEKFGEAKISQSITRTILTAYDFTFRKMAYFDSGKARKNPAFDISMKDAVIATSAAPSFFPAHKVSYQGRLSLMSDGGAAAHNNPVLVALMRAMEEEKDIDNIKVLSIGTGTSEDAIKTLWGVPTVIKPVIEAQMDGSSEIGDSFAKSLLKDNYLRLQFELPKGLEKMDNVSIKNMRALSEFAEQIYFENYANIVEFLS
jgi:patatin-like phospholipase/acyl hydrolase